MGEIMPECRVHQLISAVISFCHTMLYIFGPESWAGSSVADCEPAGGDGADEAAPPARSQASQEADGPAAGASGVLAGFRLACATSC